MDIISGSRNEREGRLCIPEDKGGGWKQLVDGLNFFAKLRVRHQERDRPGSSETSAAKHCFREGACSEVHKTRLGEYAQILLIEVRKWRSKLDLLLEKFYLLLGAVLCYWNQLGEIGHDPGFGLTSGQSDLCDAAMIEIGGDLSCPKISSSGCKEGDEVNRRQSHIQISNFVDQMGSPATLVTGCVLCRATSSIAICGC